MTQQEMIEQVVELSTKALAEEDGDKFIEDLLKRDVLLVELIDREVEADRDLLKNWLEKELDILARLEKERTQLLKEMDNLSQKKRAMRHYCPRFPFPSMPAFFDKLG